MYLLDARRRNPYGTKISAKLIRTSGVRENNPAVWHAKIRTRDLHVQSWTWNIFDHRGAAKVKVKRIVYRYMYFDTVFLEDMRNIIKG